MPEADLPSTQEADLPSTQGADLPAAPGVVGVVGLGTTGASVAVAAAVADGPVVGVEADAEALGRAGERVATLLAARTRAGELSPEAAADALRRITLTSSVADLAAADVVLVAVPEREAEHRAALAAAAAVVGPHALLATTTTTLGVTDLAVASGRPERVVGWHWSAGPDVGGAGDGLVEVVRTPLADADAVQAGVALARRLGRLAAVVPDRPGLLTDRCVLPMLNDAVKMVQDGYATGADVDAAMRLGCGHPVGPLALVDVLGVDAVRDALDALHAQTGEARHAPAPLLAQLVSAGFTGREAGRGLHAYAAPGSEEIVAAEPAGPAGTAISATTAAAPRPVSRVGVVGTGTMAAGIAEVCAAGGYEVVVRARTDEAAARVRATVAAGLDRQVSRGRLAAAEREEVLGRLSTVTGLGDLAGCQLAVEAVVEDVEVKTALFAALGEALPEGTVLATTTSSLPVVACAVATARPGDVVGMHWFNPAPAMRLVEVVPTVLTTPDVVATVRAVCERLRRHPVVCRDRAGFVVNALLFPFLNDAARLLDAHYGDVDTVDAAIQAAYGHPLGPFALMDVVGLDVTLAIQETLLADSRDPGLTPSPVLGRLVAAGFLGRKAGRGFRPVVVA